MTASCPGFLDRYGIWNNGMNFVCSNDKLLIFAGFDCSLPRTCCGTDTDRYCCIQSSTLPSSSSISTSYQSFDDFDSYSIRTSNSFISEKWLFIQMCTIAIFLAIMLLIFIIIYLCLTSMKHRKRQIPLPSTTSHLIESKRSVSNRISTMSSVSNVLNTPLNIYPTTNSRNSTASSSYYIYPNEFEYLCK